jgi:TetR/AcrR family transcriptional regulator of autoinduction and epiphytic fitness
VGETHVTDRRVARANRTRDGVVDALLELIDEGNLRPTAREIATRANVSLRSVYVHFDDVDALFRAAALRHDERLEQVRGDLPTSGSFEERLTAFVDRRARVYEVGRNVNHAAVLLEPFSPAMRAIVDQARQRGLSELDRVFAPELRGDAGGTLRAALDVVTNAKSWEALRSHHDLGVEEAKDLICRMVRGVVHAPGGQASGQTGGQLGSVPATPEGVGGAGCMTGGN